MISLNERPMMDEPIMLLSEASMLTSMVEAKKVVSLKGPLSLHQHRNTN